MKAAAARDGHQVHRRSDAAPGYTLRIHLPYAKLRVHSAEEQSESAVATLEEASCRVQEIEEALSLLESQVAENEIRLAKAELWARTAEALANDSEKALTCVETAIRSHLLEQRPDALDLAAAA
jgi:hypothetical protein